jgi:hypothetical protein
VKRRIVIVDSCVAIKSGQDCRLEKNTFVHKAVTGLQSCRVAELQGCRVAGLQGVRFAGLQGCTACLRACARDISAEME